MGPLSLDLRSRVVAAVREEGMSRRGAAERFGVSFASAIDGWQLWRNAEVARPCRWAATNDPVASRRMPIICWGSFGANQI